MIPVRLEMEAFGPYLAPTTIDFSFLEEGRIFLISGPTGAGKTSMLDAMSFALYGRGTGMLRNDWKALRSTFADEKAQTRIRFDFLIQDSLYSFRRFLRRKELRHRDGTVEMVDEEETACYGWEGDSEKLLASGAQVSKYAVELLGFTREQFAQVIVLPQGEFKKLLIAGSKDKQKILEDLFHTLHWNRLVDIMNRMRNERRQEADTLQRETETLLRAQQAESPEALAAQIEAGAQALRVAQQQAEQEGAALARLEAEYALQQTIKDLFNKYEKFVNKKNVLLERSTYFAELRQKIDQSQKISGATPYYMAWQEATAAVQQLQTAQAQAQAAYVAAQEKLEQAQKQAEAVDALTQQERALRDETARLVEILPKLKLLTDLRARYAQNQQANEQMDLQLKTEAEALAQLAGRLEKGNRVLRERFDNYISRLPRWVTRRQELATKLAAYNRTQALEAEQAQIEKALQTAHTAYAQVQATLETFTVRIEEAQSTSRRHVAAALAKELQAHAPCPVCGSTHHPAPAVNTAEAVEASMLEQLQEAHKQMQMEAETRHRETVQLQMRLEHTGTAWQEERAKWAGEEGTVSAWEAEMAALEQAIAKAQTYEAEQQKLQALRDQLLQEEAEHRESQAALQQKRMEGENSSLSLRLQIEEAEKLLTGDYKDYDSLDQYRIQQNARAQALSQKAKALQEDLQNARLDMTARAQQRDSVQISLKQAKEQLEAKAAAFEAVRMEYGLDAGLDFASLRRGPEALQQMEAEWTRYTHEVHTLQVQMAELSQELQEKENPDLEELSIKRENQQKLKTQADILLGGLQEKQKALLETQQQVTVREAAIREKITAFEMTERLYRFISGSNSLNTPIYNFVTGLMFDEIVETSNIYLQTLSRGRYNLKRMDSQGGRGYKGLELFVLDGYAGGDEGRPVTTLSGGELFLASLSLSFGLSDVVQNYAGGITIDSIFIDEGFGTLDAETLQTVMTALATIQETGRIVGIISHVAELKERIPTGIDISFDPTLGSRIKIKSG